MRPFRLALAALMLMTVVVPTSLAQERPEQEKTEPAPADTDVLALKQAEAEYTQAIVKGDVEVLRRLIADDYAAFNSKGVALKTTKESLIKSVTSGTPKTESYEIYGLEAKVEGGTGITAGTAYKKDRAQNNLVQETTMKFTRTWVRNPSGGWQVRKLVSEVVGRKLGDMPVITNVSVYESNEGLLTTIHLTIYGLNLGGAGARVTINGKEVGHKVLEQNHRLIKIEGTKRALNLHAKSPNEITVEVGGKTSNNYIFKYAFSAL
jgi:ketosteroid isomerase-like protein